METFNELLFNSSVLIAFGIFSEILLLKFNLKTFVKNSIQGVVYGLIIIILMLFPYSITEGIFIDGRAVAVIISTLFFGPLAGLITSAIGIVGRVLMIGNIGTCVGCLIIIASYLISLGFFYLIGKKKTRNFFVLYILGLIVQVVTVLLISTLASYFPDRNYEKVFISLLAFYPFVTLFIGYLINTLRKNDELKKDLSKTEQFYNSVLRGTLDAVFVINKNKQIIEVNPYATSLFGYSREELLSMTPSEIIFPNQSESTNYFDDILQGNQLHYLSMGIKKDLTMFEKEVRLFQSSYFDEDVVVAIVSDVTNKKIEYDIIVCNREKFDLIFDQAPVEVVLQSSDGKIIKANKNFLKKYQYTFEEIYGKNLDLIILEENKELLAKKRFEILKSESHRFFTNGVKKDGSMNYIEIAEKIVLLDDKKLGILTFIKDVFSKAKITNKFHSDMYKANALLTAIPDLLFSIDSKGKILEFKGNEKIKLIFSPKEFIGKPIFEKLSPEITEKTLDSIQKALETNELVEYNYSLDIEGEKQYFEARIIAYNDDELFVFVRDITKRTKQQIDLEQNTRFIKSLIESMPNPIFYMNREGIYLGANKLFRDLFNLNETEIIGKKVYDIDYSLKEADAHYQSDMLILEGKEKRQVIERDIVLPNGDVINTIMTKMSYPDSNNNIGGLIASFIDITDRKKMEQELIMAKNKAEESDRLKTAFLNNLSHEIRTPLNAIMGFGELLTFSETEEEQQECIEIIQSNGGQLLNIIDDILAVSRMESEDFEINKEVFEINSLLCELQQTFARDANLRSLELILDPLSSYMPALIYSDRGKIYRILSGFLNNAIKYTLDGKINFGCKKLINESIRFYVQDTGVGISEEEKPYIFERFFRCREAQLYAIRGNGLGLSIAKGFTKILGSSLGFESKKGIGSIFYIDIEMNKLALPFAMPEKITASKPQTVAYENLKILVVEDEIDNYLFLEVAFKDKIGKIGHAQNGKEAIDFLERESFNCIIMDTRMPVMDGIEATKKIREMNQDILIIAVSAFSSDEIRKEVKDAGCDYFLEKPFRFESLKQIIEKYFIEDKK